MSRLTDADVEEFDSILTYVHSAENDQQFKKRCILTILS